MKYDSNGMRIQKDDEDRTINYHYDSSGNLTGLNFSGTAVYFYYDSDGAATAMSLNGLKYYYIKNLQGDVVGISNQNGDIVVTYTYDSFGKIIDQTDTTVYNIANINPFRYRGYVYDKETGLYYLKSRYYDPETGRFINADIYCDTMSNIFGTNMFTYCNNNPVNQIDPEGTDAIWLQFGDAVHSGIKHAVYYDRYGGLVIEEIPEIVFGHTSLLIQDDSNVWWYFYWGPTQAILRPCGKDDFSMAELNSYLTGFDPRPHHNYYVYATNVVNDSEDVNYSAGSDYFLKCHDGAINGTIKFSGNFKYSFEYAKDLLKRLFINSNANQLCETIYENGKKYTMYHVCEKVYLPYVGTPIYYYKDIKATNNKVRSYSITSNNCVQVSIKVLRQGSFSDNSQKYKDKIDEIYKRILLGKMVPNQVYNSLKVI